MVESYHSRCPPVQLPKGTNPEPPDPECADPDEPPDNESVIVRVSVEVEVAVIVVVTVGVTVQVAEGVKVASHVAVGVSVRVSVVVAVIVAVGVAVAVAERVSVASTMTAAFRPEAAETADRMIRTVGRNDYNTSMAVPTLVNYYLASRIGLEPESRRDEPSANYLVGGGESRLGTCTVTTRQKFEYLTPQYIVARKFAADQIDWVSGGCSAVSSGVLELDWWSNKGWWRDQVPETNRNLFKQYSRKY